jgi:hypothetical protein
LATEARIERDPLRYELKYVVERLALSSLRARLRLDPSGLRAAHPPRRVQSLYLDTGTGRALAENLAGVSERCKLRFRWYGEAADRVEGALERKLRRDQLGWKERARAAAPLALEGARKSAFLRALARALPAAWGARALAGLEPAQWIAYTREYYESADRRVRVTLDRELRCHDLRFGARLARTARRPLPELGVLELKARPEHEAELRAIAARLPAAASRCSKYVLASCEAARPAPAWGWC